MAIEITRGELDIVLFQEHSFFKESNWMFDKKTFD